MLYGFPLCGKMWEANIRLPVDENHRVITPELRELAKGSNFAEINSMEEMARDVADLMDN